MNKRLLDYIPQMEFPADTATAQRHDEDAEMAGGAALLEAASGAGLDDFLLSLIRRAGPSGRAALHSPLGHALLAALKNAARSVLPLDSATLKLKAATIFGLELEGLSPEDKEFELARHFVRFANGVIDAALAPGTSMDPDSRVQAALLQAARRHAPGLLRHSARQAASGGRWQRQDGRIVVLDC
ncbi:MAG: hypothetical protein V4724_00345 [Pseudomonadota bacterium]